MIVSYVLVTISIEMKTFLLLIPLHFIYLSLILFKVLFSLNRETGLNGQSNKRLISMSEVKQHQTEGAMWTVLKGHVYNIYPYMNFHPGGMDLFLLSLSFYGFIFLASYPHPVINSNNDHVFR